MKLGELFEAASFGELWSAYENKVRALVDKKGVESGMDSSTATKEWNTLFDAHDSVRLEDKVNDLHQQLTKEGERK